MKKYEQENFIELINFFKDHFKKYPKAHIYHYNSYEKRSLRQLFLFSSDFQKAICGLAFKGEKFVDIFDNKPVCQNNRKGYVSKNYRKCFVGFKRSTDVKKAEDSVKLYDFGYPLKTKRLKTIS